MAALPTTIRGVILDLDDTLYPEYSYFRSGLDAVADWLRSIDVESLEDWRERLLQELLAGGRAGILDRIPVPDDRGRAQWTQTLLHVYRTHTPAIALFPDVRHFIEGCLANGLPLAIVTDGKSCVQHAKIRALGLQDLCRAVVCTDDVDQPKPSPVPFQIACAHLALPPQACVYIADDVSKDFIGTTSLGMHGLHIVRSLDHPLAVVAPDHTVNVPPRIRSLAEAIPMITGRSSP